ncbi:MAG: magnesium transporter [Chloroflexi bacterium]|nr:magnesium transporter [Chloroflexota bacterium]
MIISERLPSDDLREDDRSREDEPIARPPADKTSGEMLLYPADSVGGMMTLEVASFPGLETVADTLADLSDGTHRHPDISRIYVVDNRNSLLGSLSLSELIFAPPYAMLREVVAGEPTAIDAGAGHGECARLMAKHDLRNLPVVDAAGILQGAIAAEDLERIAEKRAADDVFKLLGLGGEDRALGPFWNSVRSRSPWLLLNLMTVLFAGLLISLFESTIERAALLAIFIPVVVGQAGIAGTQTVTMVVRALALNEVDEQDSRALLIKEGALAMLQGSATAVLLLLLVWAWQGSIILGLIVGSSIFINLIVAALGGVAVPLVMRKARIDPAASSIVVVTTLTEMIGILAYLGLATLLISLMVTD